MLKDPKQITIKGWAVVPRELWPKFSILAIGWAVKHEMYGKTKFAATCNCHGWPRSWRGYLLVHLDIAATCRNPCWKD
ncbi:hypothetical protein LCGC14_1262610 [marine sediment metagenome]|uniref:Uncharacterized protein n=1 Tax=marine sediment metagenome TaxID=412755 RepID=A0A0F9P3L5_9ZZZZ